MKKLFLFILLTISLILSSCKKDGEIKLNNNICLKLSDGSQLYEYDEFNRIKGIYYINSDGEKIIDKSYSYSGDTIIKKYYVSDFDFKAQVIEKSIIGNNGFIQKTLFKTIRYNKSTTEYSDSNFYDEYNYLTKTISSSGFKTYFFYNNGNLEEEWFMNGVDSFLSKKCEYDLLNENKEANWQEMVDRKGRANKNLLMKQIQGNHLYEYSYFLKNGYPITKQVRYSYSVPILNSTYFYALSWSCLK